jgi:peptide deformylase
MIKDIIQYPSPTSSQFAAPVRTIDDEILATIQDLKDTIDANSLEALSAYQIGSPYCIVVVKKDDGTFLELLNPIVIRREGERTREETTAYFPGLSAKVKRADTISVVYEDVNMNSLSLIAEGDYSALLQRKIDYTAGSSFINRLDKEEKKLFESKLEFGSIAAQVEACPTSYKRDYITKIVDYLTIFMLIVLGLSFFVSEEIPLFNYQTYIALSILVLNIIYFFYSQYELKLYGSCTNCQIGDILGTMGISLTRVFGILALSYFII